MPSSTTVFLLCLIGLSVTFACHPSCHCTTGRVCDSCVDPNSTIDTHQRSCPCNQGYFTSTLHPFVCSEFLFQSTDSGPLVIDACSVELGNKIKNVQLLCDSSQSYSDTQKTTVINNSISLDLDHASIDTSCWGDLQLQLLYKDPISGEYIPLPAKYYHINSLTIYITIPLIEFDSLFGQGPLSDHNQFTNVAHFEIKITANDELLRYHKWDLFVYTNRDEVELFTIDVTPQNTEGCQPDQECIVIADLDTKAIVCSDNTCTAERANHEYLVGDLFIAKICFVDPTYLKNLKFVDLFFKNDQNKVFKFTSITTANQENHCLIVSLPLVEPSISANIQVSMLIDDARLRRRQLSNEATTTKSQFIASILSTVDASGSANGSVNTTSNSNNANTLISAAAFLIVLAML